MKSIRTISNIFAITFIICFFCLYGCSQNKNSAEKNNSIQQQRTIPKLSETEVISTAILKHFNLEDIQKLNPDIAVKLMYSTTDNFIGQDAYGDLETCYLVVEAAEKLSQAQKLLDQANPGYKLIVYDGLRPRSVQQIMWDLVKGTDFQPYVANPLTGSIHNYGAAIDLSIIDPNGTPLDMGTPFDFFGELAQPGLEQQFLKEGKLTEKQIANRLLLRNTMKKAGFYELSIEWWHFNAFPTKYIKANYQIIETLTRREINMNKNQLEEIYIGSSENYTILYEPKNKFYILNIIIHDESRYFLLHGNYSIKVANNDSLIDLVHQIMDSESYFIYIADVEEIDLIN